MPGKRERDPIREKGILSELRYHRDRREHPEGIAVGTTIKDCHYIQDDLPKRRERMMRIAMI